MICALNVLVIIFLVFFFLQLIKQRSIILTFVQTASMHYLKRFLLPLSHSSSSFNPNRFIQKPPFSTSSKPPPSSSSISNAPADDDWNDAWETAWLPDDPSPSSSAADFISLSSSSEIDPDTKAFVAEMDERWNERRAAKKLSSKSKEEDKVRSSNREEEKKTKGGDEYRLRKQRIHAGLWMKEIEKMEEAKLGDAGAVVAGGDEIDRLLDSCAEFFDSGNIDLNDTKMPSTSEFKSKPDGWETTTKNQDGNIWEISQREEDILLQEFERRIAFSKFQIASFIKTHIFSRRRPIDGWKYMIEELGPNARRGKGSVQRLPSLVDPSTQPFKEDKRAIAPNIPSSRGR